MTLPVGSKLGRFEITGVLLAAAALLLALAIRILESSNADRDVAKVKETQKKE